MRRLAITAFLAPILVSAQQFGTKKDMSSTPITANAPALPPILPLMIALGIVFAIVKWGLPWGFKFFSKKINGKSGAINITDSAIVGTTHLHLVSVMGKTLLISSNQGSTSLLADLTNASPEPLFAEMLHKEAHRPNVAPYEIANEVQVEPSSISETLRRLDNLVGS